MTAVAYVNSGAVRPGTVTAGFTTTTVSMPASVVAGNLLVLFVTVERNDVGTLSYASVDTPTGWTLIPACPVQSYNYTRTGTESSYTYHYYPSATYVFYKIASSSEDAVSIRWSSKSAGVAMVSQFSGVDATNPIFFSSGRTRNNINSTAVFFNDSDTNPMPDTLALYVTSESIGTWTNSARTPVEFIDTTYSTAYSTATICAAYLTSSVPIRYGETAGTQAADTNNLSNLTIIINPSNPKVYTYLPPGGKVDIDTVNDWLTLQTVNDLDNYWMRWSSGQETGTVSMSKFANTTKARIFSVSATDLVDGHNGDWWTNWSTVQNGLINFTVPTGGANVYISHSIYYHNSSNLGSIIRSKLVVNRTTSNTVYCQVSDSGNQSNGGDVGQADFTPTTSQFAAWKQTMGMRNGYAEGLAIMELPAGTHTAELQLYATGTNIGACYEQRRIEVMIIPKTIST